MQIKDKYEAEIYVKLNLEKHKKSLLAQLRTGVLPLHIETGRFQNKKLEDRLCNICNSGAIESEYHFLFYCNYYRHEREQLYASLQYQLGECDSDNLHLLFEYNSRKLGKFVCTIFNKRQDKLYQKT